MRDSRIDLRDRWLAGLMAWLVPGAGHYYQGRYFKGAIYSVCILGLFLSGWAMADWSAVQPPDMRNPTGRGTLLLKYGAQLGVGLPSLYGVVQSNRYFSEANTDATTTIDEAMVSEFEGVFVPKYFNGGKGEQLRTLFQKMDATREDMDHEWPLEASKTQTVLTASGRILLQPEKTPRGGESIAASFEGVIDGQEFDQELGPAKLEYPIRSSGERRVFAEVLDKDGDPQGVLVASVPRPWLNRLAVPMSTREENQLHARHGNYLEIWMVFTWIAGLLNYLAIWDAVDGPAYGYGDEVRSEEEPEPKQEESKTSEEKASESETETASAT